MEGLRIGRDDPLYPISGNKEEHPLREGSGYKEETQIYGRGGEEDGNKDEPLLSGRTGSFDALNV